jgi:hypothetical protein
MKDSDVLLLLPLLLNLCRALLLLGWWIAGMEQRCVLVSHVVLHHGSILATGCGSHAANLLYDQ